MTRWGGSPVRVHVRWFLPSLAKELDRTRNRKAVRNPSRHGWMRRRRRFDAAPLTDSLLTRSAQTRAAHLLEQLSRADGCCTVAALLLH